MRIILFAGKGGVGKTSIAAATGLKLAQRGVKTLVMSLDPAHSLSDAFNLPGSLVDHAKGGVVPVQKNLDVQEINLLEEVHRHWKEVHSYISLLIASSGLDSVLADELAILPGMEEASSLLYINRYAKQGSYECLILDCAPTAESLRFISFPSILKWYMAKLWRIEKSLVKVARPVLRHVIDVPLPDDEYFDSLKHLYERIDGVDKILTDPKITSVRLVTNPEKMVIKETQRAFMYFCLYGLLVDGIVVNRMLPKKLTDRFFSRWIETQTLLLGEIKSLFESIPVFALPLLDDEVVGLDSLDEMGSKLYGKDDPRAKFCKSKPFVFRKSKNRYTLTVILPFLVSDEVDVTRVDDQLIIRVASIKRFVPLPRSIPPDAAVKASLTERELTITFG